MVPLLIIVLMFLGCFKCISSGYFKNILMREKYDTFIRRTFDYKYKVALILPLITVVTLIMCAIFSKFNFSGSPEYISLITDSGFDMLYNHTFLYIIGILIIQYFFSLFIANVAIINFQKCKNLFVGIIQTFLVFMLFEFIVYITYCLTLSCIFHLTNLTEYFNLLDYLSSRYENIQTVIIEAIVSIMVFVISNFIIKKVYSKKEKMVLNYEKI